MKEAPLVRNPELGSGSTHSGGHGSKTPFDPPRNSFWKQFWKWTGIFSLLSIAILFAYFTLTPHGRTTGKMIVEYAPAVYEAKTNPDLIFQHAGSDIVNILLIGRDVNYKIGEVYDPTTGKMRPYQVYDEDTPARSDTMLVVSLDRNRRTIHMVSFPRDAMVRLPQNEQRVRRAKLNAAHAYGGPEMLRQTMHEELGITIHHHAVIRFEGFKKLIDQVGGVEVDVLGALRRDGSRGPLKYDDNWGNLHIDLEPGKQLLDGDQAHGYVRFRMDIEGDPGRIKRQQQVMRALAKKLTSQSMWDIAPLLQEIRKQFETDPHFSAAEIASAASFAKGIGDASQVQPLSLYGAYGSRGSLILNKPKNIKLLNYVLGSTFNEELFLNDSPWTRRDDMGEDSNSSPGAQAILRKAGLIEGAPVPDTRVESEERDSAPVEVSSRRERSSSPSRMAERDSEVAATVRPTNRTNRARSSASTSSASGAISSASKSTPRGATQTRPRRRLSTPDSEPRVESSTSRRTESPIPVPEGLSTPNTESPVPQSE